MKSRAYAGIIAVVCVGTMAMAQSGQASAAMETNMEHHGMEMSHQHGAETVVSYSELTKTAAMLEQARHATEKYQDVRVAESSGYQAIGPEVPGMGLHYIKTKDGAAGFHVEQPPILLYEKDPAVPGGFQLVGVSYLLNAAEGPDGQPLDPPFPKALAQWHRHENLCVLADRSVRSHVNASECASLGGSFTAESQWMIHAWIWKDSPAGVFAPTNPLVK
jgi:hypothetical protein